MLSHHMMLHLKALMTGKCCLFIVISCYLSLHIYTNLKVTCISDKSAALWPALYVRASVQKTSICKRRTVCWYMMREWLTHAILYEALSCCNEHPVSHVCLFSTSSHFVFSSLHPHDFTRALFMSPVTLCYWWGRVLKSFLHFLLLSDVKLKELLC